MALYQGWIEHIETGNYEFGVGSLRNTKIHFDPFGVLLDFLDKDAWTINSIGLWEWNGLSVMLSPNHETTREVMKRCRMKTHDGSFISSNGNHLNLVSITDNSFSWTEVLYHMKNYWEQF